MLQVLVLSLFQYYYLWAALMLGLLTQSLLRRSKRGHRVGSVPLGLYLWVYNSIHLEMPAGFGQGCWVKVLT